MKKVKLSIVALILNSAFLLFNSPLAQAQIITTVAGNGTFHTGNLNNGGAATSAEVWSPEDIFVDNLGNIYIIDYGNGQIRKVNTAGIISMYAGGGSNNCPINVPATQTRVGECFALTCDTFNNLYISDINSQIVKVNTSDMMTTVAGNCTATTTFGGDGGQATTAELYWPGGVVIDKLGNMFISDSYNHRIRKVNTNGIINTIAGTGTQGYAGDGGQASAAEFNYPGGITVDAVGNLYIADTHNNRIRMINTAGFITTVAGNGIAAYSGDGGNATTAELYTPYDVALDAAGNLYIADWNNYRIRKVNTSGVITTVAGNGTGGFSGDGGQATSAELYEPIGIAFDVLGNLYIADEGNNRVRMVTNVGQTVGINQLASSNEQINIYPNPSNGSFVIQTNATIKQSVQVYDVNGKLVLSQTISGTTTIDARKLNEGVYNVNTTSCSADGGINKRLVIVK